MANKTALTILISIILTILIISVSNVGVSLFLSEPSYNDYCGEISPRSKAIDETQEFCEENDGEWQNGYCDYYSECNAEIDVVRKVYNQNRFYVFAVLGLVLLIGGLYIKENLFQYTGLATGAILILEGVVINLQNKLVVFLTLLIVLSIFGILGYRSLKNKK